MAVSVHPAATQHAPAFITAPGETDVLMVVTAFFLLFAVLGFGVLYFRLHSLPEHMAHKGKKMQLELVAVLGLISLFTHMHIFWIAALLLAFVDLPDFGSPLNRIAGSTEKLAGLKRGEGMLEEPSETSSVIQHGSKTTESAQETASTVGKGKETAGSSKKSTTTSASKMERSHV